MRGQGSSVTPEDLCAAYPHLLEDVKNAIEALDSIATRFEPGTNPPSSASHAAAGWTIPGYEILGELGRGGMGIVYKARQVALKRVVAVKMLLGDFPEALELRARFRREAEAVAGLQHANIVQIYEVGEHDGRLYFSMEFVGGGSLAQRLARGILPIEQSVELSAALARAIFHCHQRGIVHRDLKPANVLLLKGQESGVRNQESGVKSQESATKGHVSSDSCLLTPDSWIPKITDFGLAKQLAEDVGKTRSGAVLGTPSYMAPEQAAGKIKDIGPRTDVYAVGAILYELLTGQPPFRGDSVLDTLEQVRTRDPVPPSRLRAGVPRDLETICLTCLAKEPQRRYGSALLLAQDLERFQAGESILARPEGIVRKAWRKVRRHRVPVAALGVVALTLIVAVLVIQRISKTTALAREWEQGVAAPGLGEDFLARMETVLADRGLGQVQAEAERQRLYESYKGKFRAELGKRLTPETTAALFATVAALQPRAPALADQLRKELSERQTVPEPLFHLGTPFADLDTVHAVFAPDAVSLKGDRLYPVPALKGPMLTRQASSGNVEYKAVFADPEWQTASRVGLVLQTSEGKGYALLLRTAPRAAHDGNQPPVSFGEVRQSQSLVTLQIERDGRLLRAQQIESAALPAGPLTLEARREGDKWTFRIHGLPPSHKPLVFQEVFPLRDAGPVFFGLIWPRGVGLVELQATRQTPPVVRNPLEQGDELLGQGPEHVEKALEVFRREAIAAAGNEEAQEARYKQAICLARLGNTEQAAQLWQRLGDEHGTRWPILAQVQLLVLYFREGRLEKADPLLVRFSSPLLVPPTDLLGGLLLDPRPPLELLAALIPSEDLQQIWDALFKKHSGLNVLFFDPQHVKRLELLAPLVRNLDFSRRQRVVFALTLAVGYLMSDSPLQRDKALGVYEETLARDWETARQEGLHLPLVEMYCWLLRLKGRTSQAIDVVDRCLWEKPGVCREGCETLLLTQARNHAALGQWRAADNDLNALLARVPVERLPYHSFANACLLRGYVQQELGAPEDVVQAAWKLARLRLFAPGKGGTSRDALRLAGVADVQIALLVGSLTNDLTRADMEEGVARLLPYIVSQEPVLQLLPSSLVKTASKPLLGQVNQLLPAAALTRVWRTPEGQDYARKIVLQEISWRDVFQVTVRLTVVEIMAERAFAGKLDPEQRAVLGKFAEDWYLAFCRKKVSLPQVFLMAGIVDGKQGFDPFVKWETLEKDLEPSLQPGFAYLCGCRYLRLKRPDEATEFFRIVQRLAAPDTPVYRLAASELERLAKFPQEPNAAEPQPLEH